MEHIKQVYFLGIGGIGMSALARYFKTQGICVLGYDRTPSPLTEALEHEGISVHYDDLGEKVTTSFSAGDTLVVYTPAIPESLGEIQAFRKGGFRLIKRAEALAEAVKDMRLMAVAGTHGKTTTSALLSHILYSTGGVNAFLGGISNNYNTNLLLDAQTDIVVAEADEYDRSFLHLHPYYAIVTATSADHLDIYHSEEAYKSAFSTFVHQIREGGALFYKKDSFTGDQLPETIDCYSYALDEKADVYSDNIRIEEGKIYFDWHFPAMDLCFENLLLSDPIKINVENATAAIAVATMEWRTEGEIRDALASFKGTKRRFQYILNTTEQIYIDDYAHHPEELAAAITSIRSIYPDESILGIFQPHLYTRTKDFYAAFAEALSMLDQVILLPIYPAREEPIPGVSSQLIYDKLAVDHKWIVEKEQLADFVSHYPLPLPRILVTLGAGDIDRIVVPLSKVLLGIRSC